MPIEDPVPNGTPLPPEPPACRVFISPVDESGEPRDWSEVGTTIPGSLEFHPSPLVPPGQALVVNFDVMRGVVDTVRVSDEALARMREQTAEIIRRAGHAASAMAPAIQAAALSYTQMAERMRESFVAGTAGQYAQRTGSGPVTFGNPRGISRRNPDAAHDRQLEEYRRLLAAYAAQPGDMATITVTNLDPHDVSNIDEALRCFNWEACRAEDQGLGWCSEECHQIFLRQHYGPLRERPTNYPDVPVNVPMLEGDPHGPGGEAHWSAPRDHPERETSRSQENGRLGVEPVFTTFDETHAMLREEQVVIGPPWHGRPARRSTEGQPGVEGPRQRHSFGNVTMARIATRVADLVHARYSSVWVEFEYDQTSNSLRCTARNGRREAMVTWPMEEIGGAIRLEESLTVAAFSLARTVQAGI